MRNPISAVRLDAVLDAADAVLFHRLRLWWFGYDPLAVATASYEVLSAAFEEAGVKLGVHMVMEPTMAPAADMDARELAAAYAQCATGIRKSLGILAMAMPKRTPWVSQGLSSRPCS